MDGKRRNGVQWIVCVQVSRRVLQLKVEGRQTYAEEKDHSVHLPHLVPLPSVHVQDHDSLAVSHADCALEIFGGRVEHR